MDLSISALGNRVEAYLTRLGSLQYQHHAGLPPEQPIAQLQASFPELARLETYAAVREAAETASDERDRRRLRSLLQFLAGQVEQGMGASALEAICAAEDTGVVAFGDESRPLSEALLKLRHEPARTRREHLERSIGQFFWDNQGLYARRWEAAEQAARALGHASYVALRDAVSGYSAAAIAAEGDLALRQTEDAYREVLTYVLRKIEPTLRPLPSGAARRHDLQLAESAPWMAAQFPQADLLSSITRCLNEMGLPPHAEGRILLDMDERHEAFAAELQVPDEVHLSVQPGGGLEHYRVLLREFGRAQHAAGTSKSAPVEERRLGDASVPEASSRLFEHLLLDGGWFRRYLRLPRPAAQEAARIAAFNSLSRLRGCCALLGYEIELYERGPVRPLADEYEARLSQALLAAAHRGFYLREPQPQLLSACALRAWALEARLYALLLERFNEDFWRNPATGRWLRDLFSRGRRDDAESISQEVAQAPLSLIGATDRLVRVMSA